MNLMISLSQFHPQYVIYMEPSRNNIIRDGAFIRLLYGNEHAVWNGIFIWFELKSVSYEKVSETKYKYKFNPFHYHNKKIVDQLKGVEEYVLWNRDGGENMPFSFTGDDVECSKSVLKLNELLKTGCLKLHHDAPSHGEDEYTHHRASSHESFLVPEMFIGLKISGIWETASDAGITFKLMRIAKTVR